jgi:putative endonuclease
MSNHNELGKIGEEIAKKFLEEKGHKILEMNWTWANTELDLVSMEANILVFTEVKTRQNSEFGYPESAVGKKKEKQIYDAAAEYMDRLGHETEIRFDIIAITIEPRIKIEHFPDAFFPTW